MGELFSWWLGIEVLGIIGMPLTAVIFANLPDRGWALSKPLSLLALGWLIWLPLVLFASLPYSRGWILGAALVFLAGNIALLRLPRVRVVLRHLITRERIYIIVSEALFTVGFGFMGWFRALNPAVVDTEKFMDAAFISAIWRAPHLPPPDPWLSGQPINYYYFGHFLIATVAKLFSTQPGTAFNLGIALIFGLTAVAIFGVAANIAAVARKRRRGNGRSILGQLGRAIPAGLAAVALVLVLGNLNSAQVWWQQANQTMQANSGLLSSPWAWWLHRDLWLSYDWWTPSRVIPNTINEFPAFSFVLADLHAHVLALPFDVLAVGFAFNLLLARGEGVRAFGRGVAIPLAVIGSAVAIGALYAINGWDLPTYLGLALLALAMQQWLAHERRISVLLLIDVATPAVILIALVFLLYLPFYRDFVSPSQGIALVAWTDRTPIGYVFAIFGLPLFVVLSLLVLRLVRWAGVALHNYTEQAQLTGEYENAGITRWLAGRERTVGSTAVCAIFGLLLLWTLATTGNPGWTLFWCVLVVLACAGLALRHLGILRMACEEENDATDGDWSQRAELWVFVLVGTAAALVAACELVYLRDIFGMRMNTVFKLYYQAWLLLGIVGGPALVWLLRAAYTQTEQLFARAPAPQPTDDGLEVSALAFAAPINGALTVMPPYPRLFTVLKLRTSHKEKQTVQAASSALHGVGVQHVAAAGVPGEQGAELSQKRSPRSASGPFSDRERGSEGEAAPNLPPGLRWLGLGGILIWIAVVVMLACAALVYPVLAGSARTANFTPSTVRATAAKTASASPYLTLDGTAYMATDSANAPAGCGNNLVGQGSNHNDNYAIAWLNTHVSGDPVILEAPGCEWSHYSRISAFTGLPTLLGWPGGHEGEWRINWLPQHTTSDIFGQRLNAINTIYTNPDQRVTLALLHHYNVRLVYVGYAERALYPNVNLDRFARFLHVIYAQSGVTIYAVPS